MSRLRIFVLATAGIMLPLTLAFGAYLIASSPLGVAQVSHTNRVVDEMHTSDMGRDSSGRGSDDADRSGSSEEPDQAGDLEDTNKGPGSGRDDGDRSDNSGSGGGGDDDRDGSDNSGSGGGGDD